MDGRSCSGSHAGSSYTFRHSYTVDYYTGSLHIHLKNMVDCYRDSLSFSPKIHGKLFSLHSPKTHGRLFQGYSAHSPDHSHKLDQCYTCWCPQGCFTNALQALQDILSKFVYCRNHTFQAEICMFAQSLALGTHTNFQLEILTVNEDSGIVYFHKIILENSGNVSEQPAGSLHHQVQSRYKAMTFNHTILPKQWQQKYTTTRVTYWFQILPRYLLSLARSSRNLLKIPCFQPLVIQYIQPGQCQVQGH